MHHQNSDERGVALAIALLFTFIAGSVIACGTILLRSNQRTAEVRFRRESQAAQFARSGLNEALSWMRRQTAQPVIDFKPLRDTVSTPQILDTDDPEIGLVRQFRIAKNVWGRYEVWRKDEGDTDPGRLEFRRKFEAKDLSLERGFTGAGNVWLLRCIGYVYMLRDPNVNWNEPPNRVLAISTYEGEVQRLAITLPGQAAICARTGGNCTIGANGRVRGGTTGAGILHPTGTGTPSIGPLSENRVMGSPAVSATSTYEDSVRAVFGVSAAELRSMADLVIADPNEFPDPVPPNSLIYVEGTTTLTFDSSRGLNGTGIVFTEGNLSTVSGNNSSFNGLLFVQGDLTMNETADVYGSGIVHGNVVIQGTGDYATFWYDDQTMTALRREIGQYRWVGAFRSVINAE